MPKRVLLKLSGEALSDANASISSDSLSRIANEVKEALIAKPVQLAIVIGAGNIWRGAEKAIERVTADKIGMLATVMNSLALKGALVQAGLKSKVLGVPGITGFVKDFNQDDAIDLLDEGFVVIFAGGTGNPFFTTDSAAALRAAEIKADVLFKATQVDGIYNADPKKNPDAIKFDKLTFDDAIAKKLKIMDATAFSLCQSSNINICVFDFYKDGNLAKVLGGSKIGSIVSR